MYDYQALTLTIPCSGTIYYITKFQHFPGLSGPDSEILPVFKDFLSLENLWLPKHSTVANIHFLFCSLAVLDPRVGHTTDVLSPFIYVLCHSDWLFHGESCPRIDVVHPGVCDLPRLCAPGIVPCIISFPGNSLVSSWCDHSMLVSLHWQSLTVSISTCSVTFKLNKSFISLLWMGAESM